MGNSLLNICSINKFSKHFSFIKSYLNHEKIELLHLLNIDFFVEEETFCSFFLCNKETFRYLNSDKNGVMCIYEVFLYLHLLREKSPNTKINEIVDLFIIENKLKMTKSEFCLMVDYFLICIEKFYEAKINNNVYNEIETFIKQLFDIGDQQYTKEIKKTLEKQLELIEVLNITQIKSTLCIK